MQQSSVNHPSPTREAWNIVPRKGGPYRVARPGWTSRYHGAAATPAPRRLERAARPPSYPPPSLPPPLTARGWGVGGQMVEGGCVAWTRWGTGGAYAPCREAAPQGVVPLLSGLEGGVACHPHRGPGKPLYTDSELHQTTP